MSFRHFVETKATAQPVRMTDIGVIRVARTEDGELALAPTGPAYGLMVDRDAFLRSENMTVRPLEAHPFAEPGPIVILGDEPHPFDEPKGYSPEPVKVEQQEYIRLMALSRVVGVAIGRNKPTPADFHSWNGRQQTIDPAEIDRLTLIAHTVRKYLAINDGMALATWLGRATDALRHMQRAAEVLG